MSSTTSGVPKSQSPKGSNLSRYAWVLIVLLLSAAVLWRPYFAWMDKRNERACGENLKRLGAALKQYHDRFQSFPPAYVTNERGERWHSWRVLLLPFLGYQNLYDQYRFDEPWNGPHNRTLSSQMPREYGCPASRKDHPEATAYVAIVGPQTVWPEQYAVRLSEIHDDHDATIQLLEVEVGDSEIMWLEPRDMAFEDFRNHYQPTDYEAHGRAFYVLTCDGSPRKVSSSIFPDVLFGICTRAGGVPLPGIDWDLPVSEIAEIHTEPQADSELPFTDVQPYLNAPLIPGRNAVYCATFQMAWDRVREEVSAPILLSGAPEMAAELNNNSFPTTALSEESYVVVGGRFADGFLERVSLEMDRKFPGVTPNVPEATDVVVGAYAYLQKRLPFELAFDRLNQPLTFHAQTGELSVECFGIEDFGGDEGREESLRDQVVVLDYATADDFVIRLSTRTDHIVLAKIPRVETFQQALVEVQERSRQPKGANVQPRLVPDERLVIPRLALFVSRDYTELIGRLVENPGYEGLPIDIARQLIRFQLDEKGAVLESEAVVTFANGDSHEPNPRQFVFDKPFLIVLQEPQAEQPYFVAWVENAELLVEAGNQ